MSAPLTPTPLTPAAPRPAPAAPSPPWHPLAGFGFRLAFLYFVVVGVELVVNLIPWYGQLLAAYFPGVLWDWVLNLAGRHLLGRDLPNVMNGAGDTTRSWMLTGFAVSMSLIGSLAWTALDFRRASYPRLWEVLCIVLRFSLGAQMLFYGMMKVIPLQFPPLQPHLLIQPVGEISPMGLMWRFMSYSPAYVTFTGSVEVLAGLLLLFRRTALLGALLVCAVMTQVLMLNLCYDVPVKLYAAQTLIAGVVLVLPHARRLADIFLFNTAAQPIDLRGPWTDKRWRIAGNAVKTAWMIGVAASISITILSISRQMGPLATSPAISGVWEVRDFRRDDQDHPPLLTDARRWRFLTLHPHFGSASVISMTGEPTWWSFSIVNRDGKADPQALRGTLKLSGTTTGPDGKPAPVTNSLDFSTDDSKTLRLSGTLDGAKIDLTATRKDLADFPLIRRGFNWINEYPYQR